MGKEYIFLCSKLTPIWIEARINNKLLAKIENRIKIPLLIRRQKMKCPTCKDVNLVMSDRQFFKIDYCEACRGVWLDRGKLNKIINCLSAPPAQLKAKEKEQDRFNHGSQCNSQKVNKRKGFLSEMLDF